MNYDAFQKQAIALVEQEHSLIVSAPTGAGKTAIAEYVIEQSLTRGNGVIYTAPIKALSNQKFRDFSRRYPDRIGVITGDVSINPLAPVLIMTTEIFRNTILENPGRMASIHWVIFDEVHYLDDPERGTVWEESILFCPEHIRILALSATIPNVQELARWIQTIHRFPVAVVRETKRPVPLRHYFQCQNRFFSTIAQLRDGMPRVGKSDNRRPAASSPHPNKLSSLLDWLQHNQQLPAIYFCFSRARCEALAHKLPLRQFLTTPEQQQLAALINALLQRFNLTREPSAIRLRPLLLRGIAYHHAGLLPSVKEVVEQLFTSKLIKFIITTETFALGINMPAKSVIFDELRKFYGLRFETLRTRDYFQMAGRAGRRGLDAAGFVFSRINPRFITAKEVQTVIFGHPEPVHSQCNLCYATLLHLYRRWQETIYTLYPQTLHYFQSPRKQRAQALQLMRQKITLLRDCGYITASGLSEKGIVAAQVYGYELPLTELFFAGVIERLTARELLLVLGALVFEPRKDQSHSDTVPAMAALLELIRPPIEKIRRQERRLRIYPHSKAPHNALTPAIILWEQHADIAAISEATAIDEGELVRYFRMILQLLRQLESIPLLSVETRQRLQAARVILNRGEVNAEKQLRDGL